jgi:hypothetical protein
VEAEIKTTQRCIWRPLCNDYGDALAGDNRERLQKYLEIVDLMGVDLEVVDMGPTGCGDSVHQLVISRLQESDKVSLPLKLQWGAAWWRSICREVHQKLELHSAVNA